MGGDEFSERYRDKLESDLEEAFNNFRSHNESKNIFKAARTPAVFFGIAVLMYMLSGIFGLFGIYTLANSSNLLMGISLLTLALWAYIRYSGELSDFGSQLDMVADYVWENVSVRRGVKFLFVGLLNLWRRLMIGKRGRRTKNAKPVHCPLSEAAVGGNGGNGGSAQQCGRRGAVADLMVMDSYMRRLRAHSLGSGEDEVRRRGTTRGGACKKTTTTTTCD